MYTLNFLLKFLIHRYTSDESNFFYLIKRGHRISRNIKGGTSVDRRRGGDGVAYISDRTLNPISKTIKRNIKMIDINVGIRYITNQKGQKLEKHLLWTVTHTYEDTKRRKL